MHQKYRSYTDYSSFNILTHCFFFQARAGLNAVFQLLPETMQVRKFNFYDDSGQYPFIILRDLHANWNKIPMNEVYKVL